MKNKITKGMAIVAMLLLSVWSANSEIYFDLSTVGGTKVMDVPAVTAENSKPLAERWLTLTAISMTGTSGKCGTVTNTFDIKTGSSRSIVFYLSKCDNLTITANIATGRGLLVNINDAATSTQLDGTGACKDYLVPINSETNVKIKVTALTSSSAWTSFFTFTYAPKIPMITSFTAEGINAVINQNSDPKTITANLPFGTNLTSITPVVTTGGTATSYSPTGVQDFSNSVATPVVYSATDGASTTNYNVTLTANKNTDKSLNNLKIGGVSPAYDANTKTYSLILPKGTTLNQAVTFDLPFRATADFTSGNTNDFTNPLVITVTAEDGSTQAYTVNVIAASKNIAYIINTAVSNTDSKIRPELAKTYYIDNILIANVTTTTDFSMYDLVILTESPGSGSAGMKALWGINKPLLGLKMFSVNSNTWNQATATNPSPAALAINVNEPNHPIFAGITLTGVYANELDILSAAASGNGIQQSTFASDYTLAYIKGAVLANIIEFPIGKTSDVLGTTNAALQKKLMIVGIANDNQNNLTADGLKIVTNACNYLMGSTIWGTDAGVQFKDIPVTSVGSPTIGQTTATIQWNAVPGATKYVIAGTGGPYSIKGINKVKSAINVDVAGNLTSYELTGLSGGTEYSFTVKAQNAAGVLTLTPATINFSTLSTGLLLNTIHGVTFDGKTIRNAENINLKVFDATGRLVASSVKDINMSTQAKGIYIVRSDKGMLKIALTK